MDFRRDTHFGGAIPQVQHFAIIPEADLPLVGARAERERRKSVRKNMDARFERKVLGGAGPHEKVTSGGWGVPLLAPIVLAAGHNGLVGGGDFVGGAVLADGGSVNPDDP